MAVYHIFSRASDRKYDGVYSRAFVGDIEAMAFAQTLLERHPILEVWKGEVLVVGIDRDEDRAHAS
jgi:hypothetical protein